jgi:hypothetical protein
MAAFHPLADVDRDRFPALRPLSASKTGTEIDPLRTSSAKTVEQPLGRGNLAMSELL